MGRSLCKVIGLSLPGDLKSRRGAFMFSEEVIVWAQGNSNVN